MKKRIVALFLILAFAFTLFVKLSGAEDEPEVPPGMEVINVKGVRHIVPKGSKVKESGGVLTIEGHNEYSARRFSEIEERLAAIEEDIAELQKAPGAAVEVAPVSSEEEEQPAPDSGEKETQPAPDSGEEEKQVVPDSGKEEKQQEGE